MITMRERDDDLYGGYNPKYIQARDIIDAATHWELHELTKNLNAQLGRDVAEVIVENQVKMEEAKRKREQKG